MNKHLIAIALSASFLSSSAFAWTGSNSGGEISMGGQFSLALPVQAWQAELGKAPALNATIPVNAKTITIPVVTDIPVIGFRIADTSGTFVGSAATTNNVMISYGGKYDLASISNGAGNLTLDVLDANNAKLGVLNATLTSAGVLSAISRASQANNAYFSVTAPANDRTRLFSGGVGTTAAQVIPTAAAALAFITKVFPDAATRFTAQNITPGNTGISNANSPGNTSYSSAYGSGIGAGSDITITLDAALKSETQWKAIIPITVSYA